MTWTERDRMLAVYRGETPDRVPFFLDLSHWFYQKHHIPFDLSKGLVEPDWPLIEYHRKVGAGFCIPNLISYYDTSYPPDVVSTMSKDMTPDGPEITWRLETPVGTIERKRAWEEKSYSWNITQLGIATAEDLRAFGYAMSRLQFKPAFDRYYPWSEALGDLGCLYLPIGYSAVGHLLSYWMGIERMAYATIDMPAVMHEVIDAVNDNLLKCVDVVCQGPAEVIFMGDNLSSDIQSPRFFKRWSERFYAEAFRRIRAAGKYSAVHVDGRLKGLLRALADIGADCIDAVTPAPMGDLTPAQCREEAGPQLILSGGVSPSAWVAGSDEEFEVEVRAWLHIRKSSPRLIAAAGDQVPPGAPEYRIEWMRDLVEEFGRY